VLICLRGAWRDMRADPLAASDRDVPRDHGPGPGSSSPRGAYLTGVLMTLLNPMTLAFWFTVVPATAGASPGRR